jgi:hypothetical protein
MRVTPLALKSLQIEILFIHFINLISTQIDNIIKNNANLHYYPRPIDSLRP